MITGVKTNVDPFSNPAMLRQDYFRRGAGYPGGQGEGVWVAGECEMLVDGSIPVQYGFAPPQGEVWVLEYVTFRYFSPFDQLPTEFGTHHHRLAHGINFQLASGILIQTMEIADIHCNGDFLKVGAPYVGTVAAIGNAYIPTWRPGRPLFLNGNAWEALIIDIADDLTGAVSGITLSAQARAYKMVG